MQPNDESFSDSNVDGSQPVTTPTPTSIPPTMGESAQPPVLTPSQSTTFQPPVTDEQPQPVPPVAPVNEQPKASGFLGKIKSMFSKK